MRRGLVTRSPLVSSDKDWLAAILREGNRMDEKITGQAAKANLYQAEYLGSGTFRITKPKRSSTKRRQSALKNRRRGSRK